MPQEFRGHVFASYPSRNVPGLTCLRHKKAGQLKALTFEDASDPCKVVSKEFRDWQLRVADHQHQKDIERQEREMTERENNDLERGAQIWKAGE